MADKQTFEVEIEYKVTTSLIIRANDKEEATDIAFSSFEFGIDREGATLSKRKGESGIVNHVSYSRVSEMRVQRSSHD